MSRMMVVLVAALAALLLAAPFGTSTVLAASDTEAQNPELIVTLSVPDQASIGDTVAATISISNNSPRLQAFVVTGVWTDPAGESTVQSKNGLLFPGQTITRVVDYVVSEVCVPGTHQVTLSVESRGGTSTATAAVEVI
jgi:hypothetical protein